MGFLPLDLLRTASSAKVVDSPVLNRLGVQVARAVAAEAVWRLRSVPLRGAASSADLRTLADDGVVAIHDFLPRDRFARLRDEALALLEGGEARAYTHGPNHLRQVTVASPASASELERFFDDGRLHDLFDEGEHMTVRFDDCLRAVERLTQGEGAEKDPETDLHVDIFFATHKGWLYLDDVDTGNAPFVYVKRSHRMDSVRLRHEYEDSLTGNRKSRRVLQGELEERGLTETVFRVPANTLVVANTCGYHRRLRGTAHHQRHGIHLSHRANPFLPRALSPERLVRNAALAPLLDLLRATRRRSPTHHGS